MICVVEENKEAKKKNYRDIEILIELLEKASLIRKHDIPDKGGESKCENLGKDHPSRRKYIIKEPKLEPCLVYLKNNRG